MAALLQVPPRHQALAVGVLESSYGLGLMFGPPLGALTFTLGGFPAPFYLTGVSSSTLYVL